MKLSLNRICFFLVFALSVFSTHAELPPFWNSVSQIKAILDYRPLGEKIFGPIQSVERISPLTYKISTLNCMAQVLLKKTQREGMIGPSQYQVESIRNVHCHH